MSFKVIITYPSVDDDEHTYYGMVFLKDGKSKLKKLQFSSEHDDKRVEIAFDGSPVEPNENYLAVLIAVNESETIRKPVYRIQFNNPAPVPEIANFLEDEYL
ncbi:MAG TPA: hypothetical protein VD815_04000 [Candidatus Saccharimonadales bacterium]|nr:hypothetical protein [Candidatus Saccharimonadales bacterium]